MRWLSNRRVGTKLGLMICLFLAGLLLVAWEGFESMTPQVEQSDYNDIVEVNILLADVLPPPKYIIETHLEALELLHAPKSAHGPLLERVSQLQAEYKARQDYWTASDFIKREPALSALITQKSHEPAVQYFRVMNAEFLPALAADDKERADQIFTNKLAPLYAEHRAHIDASVSASNAYFERLKGEVSAAVWTKRGGIIVLCLLASFLGSVLGLLVTRAIAKPLSRTAAVMRDVASGDLTVRVGYSSQDEIGQFATSFDAFLDNIHDGLVQTKQVALHVESSTREMSSATETLAQGAQSLAGSSALATRNVEEISQSLRGSSSGAAKAAEFASRSLATAEEGRGYIRSAIESMKEISESSTKIANIITKVDEIAFQTNLLALNAAVEAARAGAQGRGFAVVAAEVRNLAGHSAEAAKEIKALIEDSVARVQSGSARVDNSGKKLEEIVRAVQQVTTLIEEQAAASRAQANSVNGVTSAVTTIDDVAQSTAAQTEELAATATSLADRAGDLRTLVDRYTLNEPQTETDIVQPQAHPAKPRRKTSHQHLNP